MFLKVIKFSVCNHFDVEKPCGFFLLNFTRGTVVYGLKIESFDSTDLQKISLKLSRSFSDSYRIHVWLIPLRDSGGSRNFHKWGPTD